MGALMSKPTAKQREATLRIRTIAVVFPDEGAYVAMCPQLGVVDHGRTPTQALKNLEKGMDGVFKLAEIKGTLLKYLESHGYIKRGNDFLPADPMEAVIEVLREYAEPVPPIGLEVRCQGRDLPATAFVGG